MVARGLGLREAAGPAACTLGGGDHSRSDAANLLGSIRDRPAPHEKCMKATEESHGKAWCHQGKTPQQRWSSMKLLIWTLDLMSIAPLWLLEHLFKK